jgi:protein MpaA
MCRSLSVSGDTQAPPDLADSHPPEEPWAALDLLASESPGLAKWRGFALDGRVVPSYVFIGPRGGRVPIRLALFGGIEPGDLLSTNGIVKLLVDLDLAPLLAQDFALFGYPVANPHRTSRNFPNFADDFWKNGSDPVIQYFEQELTANELDGIIAVKSNEPIAGFQIQASSRVIASEVLWPVLELVQRFVPLASEPIQIFPQLQNNCHSLFSLGHARPGPFSLMIRTPKHMPFENQISAIVFGVEQILRYYRVLVSHAASL